MTTPEAARLAEEATFDVWFEQHRMQTWLSAGCDKDRGPVPSAAWGLGYRSSLLRGWLARAALSQPDEARDAARLDWLESDGCTQVFKIGNRWYTRAAYHMPHRRAVTLRAAIDAAMSQEKQR